MSDSADAGPGSSGWKLGDVTNESLDRHLRLAARTAANEALRSFDSPSPAAALWSATAAGIATEAAMKLCLAAANPAFLASNTESAIRITQPSRDLAAVRTLSGQEAARAVRLLYPNHPVTLSSKNVDTVLTVRNIAAHLGIVDTEQLSAAIQAMVVVVGACLKLLDDTDDFWEDQHLSVLDQLKAEEIERSQLALELKKAAAHRNLERRLAGILPDQVRRILEVLEAPALRIVSWPEIVSHVCPVCERQGALFRYVTESDTDFTGSRYPDEYPSGLRYAYPETFSCSVCQLELSEDEIAQESSFEDVLEEEVDPSDEFERALDDWKYEQRQERAWEERAFARIDDPDL